MITILWFIAKYQAVKLWFDVLNMLFGTLKIHSVDNSDSNVFQATIDRLSADGRVLA